MARIHVERYKFCPQCGGPLEKCRLTASKPERLCCSNCDFIFFLDPKLVVLALVPMNGGLVLVRQARADRRDLWVLPGGFVDLGETLEEATAREVHEEICLSIRVSRLLNAYSYLGEQKVALAYLTEYISGELAPGDETLEARVFSPEEIPWDLLGFKTTRQAIRDYLRTLGSVRSALITVGL